MKWKKTKLGDITEVITKGTTPTTIGYNFTDEGINFVKIESIAGDGNFLIEKMEHISGECNEKMKRSQLKENDILFSIAGAIGRTAIVDKAILPANTNQALAIIRLNTNQVLPKFLAMCLKSEEVFKQFEKKKQGVAQLNLSLKNIDELEITYPDIQEQERILHILNKSQNIINRRKAQIQCCDELIKSQFIEMFGDIVSNTKNWNQEILENHLQIVGGYAFKSDKFTESGIPVLKIGNINAGYFKDTNLMYWEMDGQLKRYEIYPGDLVISLTGTVGKDDYGNVCIMGDAFPMYYLNQRNAKLDLKNTLDKYYLTYALKVPGIKLKLTGISRGVRQANISNKDIQNLEMPIPPLELQNEFAQFVKQVDKLKFEMGKSLHELEDNFNSLMQRAFNGQLFQ